MKKNKYYIIRNKALATTIGYLLNRDYYTWDSKEGNGKKVYSFLWDDEFDKIMRQITEIRNNNL